MTTSNSTPAARSMANHALSRRNLLLLGGGVAAAAALAGQPFWAPPARAADEFDGLLKRWADYLTGGSGLDTSHPTIAAQLGVLSAEAAGHWASSTRNPAVDGPIWADLPLSKTDAANTSLTYSRIFSIAKAWATVGTDQYGNADVAATLVVWYRRMYTDWYTPTSSRRTGNWWFWEIGIPRTLGDLSIVMDSLLTPEDRKIATDAIRKQAPNPNMRTGSTLSETGGNRADKVLACILRGIVARNAGDLILARDALSDTQGGGKASLFKYVTSGNGFYADGSYVDHDRLPYVGTYGNVALIGVSRSLMVIAGSTWDVADPNKTVILDAATKSFAPFIFSGRMMETVRGRAVSRQKERDFHDAWTTANALMLLGTQIAEPYRSTYRSLAKGWLTSCSEDYTRHAGLSDLSRALPLLADASVTGAGEKPGHLQFGAQERMVHRSVSNGATWAYTVSTSSKRIGRYEWGNNENNLGWHHGDGAAYLHLASDQGQFADDFWPTVDPYRLPGTTASLAARASGASGAGTGIPRAANNWGGGVGLAGKWGTAGMDLTNSLGNVSAKKSWFLLDQIVIAIGSGVSVTGSDAETIVENRSFPAGSAPLLTVDDAPVTSAVAGLTPSYAHLDGIGGYIFLGEQPVRAGVAERTGSWFDINSGSDTGGSKDAVTRTYATLSVQHPAGTTGGKYGYVIVPGATAERTRDLAAELEIDVLRQDDIAHVVQVSYQGRWHVFAHLFAATDTGPVRSDAPVAVLASGMELDAQVAVSSPTKSITAAKIELELDKPFRKVVSSHERLRIKGGGVVTIDAALSGAAGASFEATLRVV